MAPCSHHWQKAQSCRFQQESGRDLCQQPSVPWAWPCRCSPPCCLETCGSRGACGVGATGSPAGRFPGREGSSTALLRFPLTRVRCLPSAQVGEAHLPPWLSGLCRSPCHHLQERMLPCEPDWGSPGSHEAQRGPEPCDLGPAPHPCLPGHRGNLGFMLLG